MKPYLIIKKGSAKGFISLLPDNYELPITLCKIKWDEVGTYKYVIIDEFLEVHFKVKKEEVGLWKALRNIFFDHEHEQELIQIEIVSPVEVGLNL